mmetsp:Transcript_16589/g.27968  ORF Transcript_16589/g.27968 Transcript_16589/m.27968 type:complete len:332 (+) Transcript_16589:91-1086(+)|eukprot:CAMPEP_0198212410 /NCGR_PEP_ID=MMETSP1445-20131203/25950_1 /TAXON_ID=36898 /ORGANISM="Pyramimonas sp., Strain CCMP2087" /LENGTH=331 /DNA_ID=CAMNT_0043886843 /DNA_START=89 /DNA_END=1084 /DNA_ORIENTATION=+
MASAISKSSIRPAVISTSTVGTSKHMLASSASASLAGARIGLRPSFAKRNVVSKMSIRADLIQPTPGESASYGNSAYAGAPPQQRGGDVMGDAMGLLLKERIVFLGSQVDDFSADAVISQILMLDAQDSTKDIRLFINSPGGSVTAGMGIYDAMQMARCDISTVCFGLAASMGAFLLSAGAAGKRYSMPNSRIMIHQPLGGASGQAVDIEIQAREIMYHKANLNRILAYHCNQPVTKVDEDTDRDRYMSPIEAKAYGIIDHVIGGDEATMVVEGDVTDFYKTKKAYIAWGDDDTDDGSRASRFTTPRIPKFDVDKVNEPGEVGARDPNAEQ